MSKSKAAPFMTVEFKIDRDDVEYAVECIVDDLYDSYDTETIEALGLDYKAFKAEVKDMYEFSQMIKRGVERYGPDAINDPYDYMDFEIVTRSPEYRQLTDTLDMLGEVLNDAEKHERALKNDPCAEAIKTLQAAGFKIVKA